MKILVVQEDRKIAGFIRSSLEREGFVVDEASDGDEALRRVNGVSYTAAIMDVTLPVKDGVSVVSEIRSKNNKTPVIFLSAKDSTDDIVAGLDAGADDYMKKPFNLPELIARVKALQRRTAQERGAKIHFADLCIDPVAHTAWRGNKEIALTAKEYQLLEYLMRNPKRALTRDMIANAVWERGFGIFSNLIDVYVNYLRRKIDRGHRAKLIRTIRGVGYILTDEK